MKAARFVSAMRRIRLKLNSQSDVLVGNGLYSSLMERIERAGFASPVLIVSQPRILSAIDRRPLAGFPLVTIPDGERAKRLSTVTRLLDAMIAHRLSRQSIVVALGGGVVGDVAGFAASIYLRGIAVAQVPTTLVAQVDSSVGGKTGVNHPAGKNLIGTFHQPRLVIVDPKLLATLPTREYRSGLYEAFKYGVIRDPEVFETFQHTAARIQARDPAALERLVYRCLRTKTDVVSADERESDLRRILNFGHTVGHAIEAASGYRRLRHGEAVGHGMLAATRIASQLGRISVGESRRIEAGIRSIGTLPGLRPLTVSEIIKAMRYDKKIRNGQVHFVLPRRVGKVEIRTGVPPALVRTAIRSLY